MGRYRTSFAFEDRTEQQLVTELQAALAQLDLLTNGEAQRLRGNEQVASLNQLSRRKRSALRQTTLETIAAIREEMRRRGVIFPES